jgi:serine/threonine protein kinase
MAITSTSELVEQLLRCHLLNSAQEAELRAGLAAFPDVRSLAAELMRRGWLTAYQVNRLVQGRGAELVLGQYDLLEKLGEGGMGQVYKARHQLMDRLVALKVIRRERLGEAQAQQRFLREARAAAQLRHPNVVLTFDAGQVGETPYFVMEYVEGIDLGRLVAQRGPLPVAQACEYARQAALGLQHAHERGMVHRDVKPSNLLVTHGGTLVKLLDLGLALLPTPDGTREENLTAPGVFLGTPAYTAPEQATDARRADIRADLYSLGCTLYFLLTGRPPFNGTMVEMLAGHLHDEATPVEQLRPEVPAGVGKVVRRLLAKRPEQRYQTPAEVARALAPYSRPVTPAPVADADEPRPDTQWPVASPCASSGPAPPPAAGQPRKRRLLWAAVLGLLFAGACLSAHALLAPPDPENRSPSLTPLALLVLVAAVVLAVGAVVARRWVGGKTRPAAAAEAAPPLPGTALPSSPGALVCPGCQAELPRAEADRQFAQGHAWAECPACGKFIALHPSLQPEADELQQLHQSVHAEAQQVDRLRQSLQTEMKRLQTLQVSLALGSGEHVSARLTQERRAADTSLQEKIDRGEFDTFLAHNARDKPHVLFIAGKLKERGLYPWLDKEQIPPGGLFQDHLQEAIAKVKSLTVFLGPAGLGDWEAMELRALISQCVEKKKPVIPVLLPGVADFPANLLFLRQMTCVRFNQCVDESEALADLEWGITGKRPAR